MNLNFDARPDGLVYLIQYADFPIFKIGHTKDARRRVSRLQILLPHQIELKGTIYTDAPRWLEGKWHSTFASQRRVGSGYKQRSEWFDLTDSQVAEFMKHDGTVIYKPKEMEDELPNLFTESEKEKTIKRVELYFDQLCVIHPSRMVKLINACNFQVRRLNQQLSQTSSQSKETHILKNWERGAYLSAQRKIE